MNKIKKLSYITIGAMIWIIITAWTLMFPVVPLIFSTSIYSLVYGYFARGINK